MPDVIGIAGLALAIFDQLLKLGERTAELAGDIRRFEKDSVNIVDKIYDENSRTRALRRLLFDASPAYGGRALFECLDDDVQYRIEVFLRQLKGIIQEAFELLQRHCGPTPYSSSSDIGYFGASTASTSTKGSPSILSSATTTAGSDWYAASASHDSIGSAKTPSRSPLLLIRWSFRDKKRLIGIIENLSEVNGRIHEHVKLCCLSATIGINVNVPHLQRLQTDSASVELGFNIDANLKLSVSGSQPLMHTLELNDDPWISLLNKTRPVEERFAVLRWERMQYLQENRSYNFFIDPRDLSSLDSFVVDERTKQRVDALASLLSQPKELVFRIPRCIGWKYLAIEKRIAFLFDIPGEFQPSPYSLVKLLRAQDLKPSLSKKLKLAAGLAKCIAQLHMVRWVHESFRSENILFFPSRGDPEEIDNEIEGSGTERDRIDFGQPWVLGFEFSRPDSDFSVGQSDICPAREVYRHPERQGQPRKMFNKLHDIYALGVVLLEIGLWAPAITLEKNGFVSAKDPYAIRAYLLKQAERRLDSRMGDKYREIVVKCLTGDFDVSNDTKEDMKLQMEFRSQVVEALERASTFI